MVVVNGGKKMVIINIFQHPSEWSLKMVIINIIIHHNTMVLMNGVA